MCSDPNFNYSDEAASKTASLRSHPGVSHTISVDNTHLEEKLNILLAEASTVTQVDSVSTTFTVSYDTVYRFFLAVTCNVYMGESVVYGKQFTVVYQGLDYSKAEEAVIRRLYVAIRDAKSIQLVRVYELAPFLTVQGREYIAGSEDLTLIRSYWHPLKPPRRSALDRLLRRLWPRRK